ncbi:MAG TPA: amidohydrolase family protein [Bryobacteraceae bacterium]|nr:amidohydrolase family protein [Bryobacteraceae bacterium]
MRLTGARIATGPRTTVRQDVTIHDGLIHFDQAADQDFDLRGYLLLPGLINAHDHLEFNLFPRLGDRLYNNAREWASDIFRPSQSPVREHLAVPKSVRLHWGGLRNLLSGVTTVAHHNPFEEDVFDAGFPVRVLRRFAWAHSLDFTPDLAARHRGTPADWPFIIHAGEGTDAKASLEIARLDQLGVLDSRTVLVHAIAAGPREIALLHEHRCSIVLCPGSNLAIYGRTLSEEVLASGIPIALGTDSALTCPGDLADELSTAHSLGVDAERLYRMVTTGAASILRLTGGEGEIRDGGVADLIAMEDRGQTPAEALLALEPRMVMLGGRISLLAGALASGAALNPIRVESRGTFYVKADVSALCRETSAALGPSFALAGKRIAA